MVAEKQINEFISRLRLASGENLESVILYGSAADGEFHPDFSNINLLCVLREASFSALVAIAPALEWWTKQKHHEPLVLTHEELETSIDVFSIELLDMQQRHHVLFGADVLSGLKIPMHLHRAQLEYELRAKLILLRERLLLSANDKKQLWDLMLRSLSTFTTLFRHGLIALGASSYFLSMLVVAGIVLMLLGRMNFPLGRLPGDFLYRGKNSTVYFPLATSLVVSVVLSIVLYLVSRWRR